MEQSRETYSISDLAHEFDVTPRAIRLLERQRTGIDEKLAEIRAFELQSKKLLGERGRRAVCPRPRPRPTRTATS